MRIKHIEQVVNVEHVFRDYRTRIQEISEIYTKVNVKVQLKLLVKY